MGITATVKVFDDNGNIKDAYKLSPVEIRANGISTKYVFEFEYNELNVKYSEDREMTINEVLNRFKETFPSSTINDYRPICHELFTDGKVGLTIWLNNGDVIEYYPNIESEGEE